MKIGEIARRSSYSIDTLRYYEKIGLIPHISRDDGGRRRYDAQDLDRLHFIRRAQSLRLSLEEIGQLLAVRDRPETARVEAKALTERKLAEIETQLRELQSLKAEFVMLLKQCRASAEQCPIIDHMQRRSSS